MARNRASWPVYTAETNISLPRSASSDAVMCRTFSTMPRVDSPVSDPCQTEIQQLFAELPEPKADDKNNDIEQQNDQYKKAFTTFLSHALISTQHSNDCQKTKDAVTRIMERNDPHGLRILFIEAVVEIFAGKMIGDNSAMGQYIRHAIWIFYGRRDCDYSPFVNGRGRSTLDGKRSFADCELSRLDMLLTAPLFCSYSSCSDKRVRYWCGHCAQKDRAIVTGYCSKECMTLDRPFHKHLCSARTSFARTVTLMKSLLMILQEWITDITLSATSERQDAMFLVENPRHWGAMRGDIALHPFVRNKNIDEKHVNQVLEDQYAPYISGPMDNLIPWLWHGVLSPLLILKSHY
ncbi:hypothetical protein K449DRAFT_32905 [Hypoxylon sp. EC38]|nr:hypothetical protein K449DRAFT_32905 [Hypoxylon sp. EC38]